jgi:hypothetical protein
VRSPCLAASLRVTLNIEAYAGPTIATGRADERWRVPPGVRQPRSGYGDTLDVARCMRLLMSFKTARAVAGSGEGAWPDALFAAARCVVRCGSFMACGPARCRGEAWLKKGLHSSK